MPKTKAKTKTVASRMKPATKVRDGRGKIRFTYKVGDYEFRSMKSAEAFEKALARAIN